MYSLWLHSAHTVQYMYIVQGQGVGVLYIYMYEA
jgi:hypothetical protein